MVARQSTVTEQYQITRSVAMQRRVARLRPPLLTSVAMDNHCYGNYFQERQTMTMTSLRDRFGFR